MSYQVLARKWRPKTFEQLMGQEHVVTVLVNALTQQRLHHAYLFTGTRGVGKTTIARIFAKSLNCETGITATPCGKCDTCLDIDQGRFVDLLEIDAASKTKVDDTREILDNVQYAPTNGRFKVYLIDEVHMLSRHSFNALLKTLEEPPAHVKFILATTDPQKLPITVLSRCLQFHLKALTVQQIEEKLTEILSNEQVTHQAGTLTLLAKAARGSMRDSLSLTDQAIAQGEGHITLANIQQMLGGIDQNWVYKIVIALLKQNGAELMALSQEIASYAPSYSRLFAELIQLFHQIAMLQIVDQHFDLPNDHAELLKKFSQTISAQDVQLYYQITINGRKDLPYAGDEQAAFDMTLLRLLAFKPMQISDIQSTLLQSKPDAFNVTPSVLENVEATDLKNELDEAIVKPESLEQAPLAEPVANALAATEENVEVLSDSTQNSRLQSEMQSIEQQASEERQNRKPIARNTDPLPQQTRSEEDSVEYPTTAEFSSENDLTPVNDKPIIQTPVDAVLATRNMLRSRKKLLDSSVKKSNDVSSRHTTQQKNTTALQDKTIEHKVDVSNEIVPAPVEPYQPDAIDPATIKLANQVDKWAHMIDSMALNGRIRQLAIHAVISKESTDEHLILQLNQTTKHLNTENAHQQLQQFICEFLNKNVVISIEVVDQTIADPYQIQSHINDKRYDYAKALLQEDDIVKALQNDFQATLDEQTITAR